MGGDLDFGFEPSGISGFEPTLPGEMPDFSVGETGAGGAMGGGAALTSGALSDIGIATQGGGSGWQNFLSGLFGAGGGGAAGGRGGSGLDTFLKTALGAGQLGLAGYQTAQGVKAGQQLAGQTKLATQSGQLQMDLANRAAGAAQPLTQFSQQELMDAQQGKVPAAIQQNIDLWLQAAKARVMDYAARSGQGDSSQLQSWLAWLDQQAEGMKAQALQQMQQLGISAGTAGGNILAQAAGAAGGAGRQATEQQRTLEALIAAANQSLGRLTGGAS